MLVTLYHKGAPKDGMTAYQRWKGRPWKVVLPAWGESVEFRLRGGKKFESKWSPGIFVGINRQSGEKAVATESGVHWVVSVKRRPEALRWDGDLLKKLKGVPWSLKGEGGEKLPRPLALPAEVLEAAVEEPKPFRQEPVARNLYITQKNLEKFGYTAGCPACDAARAGRKKAGIRHSETCRGRIEDAMSKDPIKKDRYDQVLMKHFEAHVEKDMKAADSGVQEKKREPEEEIFPEIESSHPSIEDGGPSSASGSAEAASASAGPSSGPKRSVSDPADERSTSRR